ncbi:MAG: FAD-dependent oxidoreductase, partial [Planctomycetota bacterium]
MGAERMREYDLCVIGSGPAGQRAAIQAAKLGKRVCVIEKKDVVGGAAINTGTIPSKALREAILKAGDRASAMPTMADFSSVRHRTFESIRASAHNVIQAELRLAYEHLSSNDIDIINGHASFRDERTVDVVGPRGSDFVVAENFLVAVGTRPAKPDHIDFGAEDIVTSDEIVSMPELPRSMIVVGGGVIGTEYASMMSALGVKVTLVEGRDKLLDFVDDEITEALQYHLRQNGMTLRLGEKVTKIQRIDKPDGARSSDGTMVEAMLESGKMLRADSLLYAIGRQGCTDSLSLQNVGLAADHRGRLRVDENFQTDAPSVYAAGDVIGFPA